MQLNKSHASGLCWPKKGVCICIFYNVPDIYNWQNSYEFSLYIVKLHYKNYNNASCNEVVEQASCLFWSGKSCSPMQQ